MERVLLVIFLFTLTNATIDITKLRLLTGWNAQIVTNSVPEIRQMALTPDESIIFAGSSVSNVYAVPITKINNIVSQNGNVKILLQNQSWPHGVAFDPTNNDLYFSSNYTSVFKLPNIVNNLDNIPVPVVIFDKFPNSTAYPSKHLRFNKDFSRIYTSQGSPCDHCMINYSMNPPSYSGTIVSFLKNGTNLITHAFGVRDTVGLAFNPFVLNELWFTDTNRNGLGNNIPPSELNRLSNVNQVPNPPPHYGFPYCYGNSFSDTTLNGSCLSTYVGAQYLIQSHSLPLGLTFTNSSSFTEGTVLIAERGSTGSTVSNVGFRVVMFNVNNAASTETVFVDGWLQNGSIIIGRPVDVVQMNDGSILVSDETAGAIIRFYYIPPSPQPAGTPSPQPAGTPSPPAGTPSPPAGTPSPQPAGTPSPPAGTPSGGRGGSSLQNWFILFVCTMAILTFV